MSFIGVVTLVLGLSLLLLPLGSSERDLSRTRSKPPLQLASQFSQDIVPAEYLVSEKLDGVRGYWTGSELLTRQGYPIAAPAWFVADFPDYPLDGELWLARGSFESVSTLVRHGGADDALWHRVSFRVFDLPAYPAAFAERYAFARTHLNPESAYLKLIPQFQLDSIASLYAKLDASVAAGAEGLVLHRKRAPYAAGRNQDMMKLKPHYDAEAEVIGYRPGKGQFSGMMGALVVRTPEGLEFSLGIGFNLKQRQQPPAIGTLVTYQYSGLTANGLPRFARFLRIRSD
ncbi:DNA ligase [Shewanella sp. AS16]|uniref:DNA ligase n=1 Tax=Shewanella sp. AS16 TaxID=2907625 RepID=UPI001F2FB3CC|nr:DNA ligase [Shewanella sp. AS16]MCE9687509.1 DNA ligase [Shewanella sp. AS16]